MESMAGETAPFDSRAGGGGRRRSFNRRSTTPSTSVPVAGGDCRERGKIAVGLFILSETNFFCS